MLLYPEVFWRGEHDQAATGDSECCQYRPGIPHAVGDVTLVLEAAVDIYEVCLRPNGLVDFMPSYSILVVPFEIVPFNVKFRDPGPRRNPPLEIRVAGLHQPRCGWGAFCGEAPPELSGGGRGRLSRRHPRSFARFCGSPRLERMLPSPNLHLTMRTEHGARWTRALETLPR